MILGKVACNKYEGSRSTVLLEVERFSVEQGVAQGCSLSPILFPVLMIC